MDPRYRYDGIAHITRVPSRWGGDFHSADSLFVTRRTMEQARLIVQLVHLFSRVVGGRCGRPHLLLCLRDSMPVFEFIACTSHFNWSGGLVWTLSRPNLRRARGQGGNRRDLTKPDLSKLPSEPTATLPRRIVTATHRTTCAPSARHIRVGSD